jgi:hypothetical protein
MKRTAAIRSPTRKFLLKLESTNDEDLRSATLDAKALAQTELASAIDTLVETMARDILATATGRLWEQVGSQVEPERKEVTS